MAPTETRSHHPAQPATAGALTPLRIGLIAPPWLSVPPQRYGGTEQVVDDLARGLSSAGHEVLLYATGDSTCPVATRWTYPSGRSERIGEAVIELRHLLDAREALADADIVHDHTVVGPVLAAVSAAAARPTPCVTTCHGPFDQDLLPIYRRVAAHVPLIAISRHQATTAADVPVAAVIHHGVDPARYPVGRGDGGYLLFLGRMAPSKGVDVAARVARAAGAELKIAAKMREPSERAYFEESVRPLLGQGVEFIGEVGGVDKLELLGGATALLNPIRWDEPFGMVMIEALACGTPVVATPHGSVPEIVDHGVTGFVVDGVAALTAALSQLDELDRAACRAVVESRFSAQRMVDDHVQLYRRLIHSGTGVVDLTAAAC